MSEYHEGYAAGVSAAQQRLAALSQAAHDLKGSAPSSDVVARAKTYLDFLEGKSGITTGLRCGPILAQNSHREGPEYEEARAEMRASQRARGLGA